MKDIRSTPPENTNGSDGNRDSGLPVSNSFHARFLNINHLDKSGFKDWLFASGMLFGARAKWWGDGGERSIPHEGIDLKYYRTIEGKTTGIGPDTKIPVTFNGTVVAVIDDFLGKSVFVKHEQYHQPSAILFTVYGHTSHNSGIHPGMILDEEDIIGTVSDTGGKRQAAPYHLHISAAWVPDTLTLQEINWETFGQPGRVVFIDPLPLLKLPYSVVQSPDIL
jgi:hypothetical protein